MTLAGGDDVIVRLRLLQHQPHPPHVIARKTPVSLCVEITERERIGESKLDPRNAVTDFARDKFKTTTRRFVVEQNARHRIQVVAPAVIAGDVMGKYL